LQLLPLNNEDACDEETVLVQSSDLIVIDGFVGTALRTELLSQFNQEAAAVKVEGAHYSAGGDNPGRSFVEVPASLAARIRAILPSASSTMVPVVPESSPPTSTAPGDALGRPTLLPAVMSAHDRDAHKDKFSADEAVEGFTVVVYLAGGGELAFVRGDDGSERRVEIVPGRLFAFDNKATTHRVIAAKEAEGVGGKNSAVRIAVGPMAIHPRSGQFQPVGGDGLPEAQNLLCWFVGVPALLIGGGVLALHIVLIMSGNSARINDTCSAAPSLPIWMIVSGSISLTIFVLLPYIACYFAIADQTPAFSRSVLSFTVVMVALAISGLAFVAPARNFVLVESIDFEGGSGSGILGEAYLDATPTCSKTIFKESVAACVLYVVVSLVSMCLMYAYGLCSPLMYIQADAAGVGVRRPQLPGDLCHFELPQQRHQRNLPPPQLETAQTRQLNTQRKKLSSLV
jgi:hypothetical protein